MRAALPGGYRLQIVRRGSATPREISGEWAVHCTLCKYVHWTASHDAALKVAHRTHPTKLAHQKWIGRVLVGGDVPHERGYHHHHSYQRIGFTDQWSPSVVPLWVEDKRRSTAFGDDLTRQRRERSLRQARANVDNLRVTLHLVGHKDVQIDYLRHSVIRPAQIVAVRVQGAELARVLVFADGRWGYRGRLYAASESIARVVAS